MEATDSRFSISEPLWCRHEKNFSSSAMIVGRSAAKAVQKASHSRTMPTLARLSKELMKSVLNHDQI